MSSRRLDSPTPGRETRNIEVGTPNQGNNVTLTKSNIGCQKSLGENNLGS